MNPLLMKLLARCLMAPAGDDGSDTGGTDTGVVDDAADGGADTGVVDDAADGGADTGVVDDAADGGAEDRGDNFVPTSSDDDDDQSGSDGTAAGGTADAAGSADADQADDGADDDRSHLSPGIPKGRFNEVNERKKVLETENEQLKRELAEARAAQAPAAAPAPAPQAAPAFDMSGKEQEYAAALIEGDTSKAAKIRGDINAHLIDEAESRADARVQARTQEQLLREEVSATLATHAWLDTAEGAEALDLILAARDRAIAQGVAPHQALRSAVSKIAPRFAPAPPPPSGDLPKDGAPVDTRSANAVKRGAADSVAQPPAVQVGIGNRATPAAKVDVEAMDDAQFAALSPAEKSRLRGD